MKTKLYLSIFFAVILLSCSKEDTKPVNAISSDESLSNATAKTRSELLTAHPWVYKDLYFHYVDYNSKGDPQYSRGATGNILNLNSTIFYFKTNGSLVEYDGGYRYPGTWSFTNSADTVLTMDFTYWKDVATIVKFDKIHLDYTQPLGYKSKTYTELIPPVQ